MASGEGEDFVLVAAIDFGTTFSGYAFSFIATKDSPDLPEKIRTNKSWGASLGFQSYKSPTSVLTTKSGKFLEFGFDAEKQYSEAIEDEDVEPDMLLFRHFKMMLHNREDVKLSATISSVCGTINPALDIVTHALRYLKDHMLKAINLETGSKCNPSLVRWVITVPAIWSDESKQFMRQAAFQAGCITEKDSKKLMIALEPEAASLCCRRLNIAQYASTEAISFPVGTKYIVLDCGGGTVDITAHVTEFDKKVKELLHASGGAWGGTEVDRNFVEFMESILGKNFLNTYRQQYPHEWLQFLTTFEKVKKGIKPDGKSKLSISLPWSMGNVFPSINKGKQIDKVLKASTGKGITFAQGVISINNETARKFFQPVMTKIVQHVETLIQNPKLHGLRYILMVGGFSESELLQEEIKAAFGGNGTKVLIPSEAQMAIIKGAVLFGHAPDEIQSRILKKTYGCETRSPFDEHIHDESRRFTDEDGVDRCDSIFQILIEKYRTVKMGETIKHTFHTLPFQASICFNLHTTDKTSENIESKHVTYVDEPGMTKIGQVDITDIGTGPNRDIELSLKFGTTEIEVSAYETKSKRFSSTVIDFLSK